jgi:hypothetical protein
MPLVVKKRETPAEITIEKHQYSTRAIVAFWLVWGALLFLVPFYAFTFFFEVDSAKSGNIPSIISPIMGGLVVIAELFVLVYSVIIYKFGVPLSKLYLVLLGGSALIAFVWLGGCLMMGPLRLAG